MPDLPEQIVTLPEELIDCCAHLAACRQFGLDTEFVGEESYHPRLCLVQVATAERLYLIDPLSAGPLDTFWKLVIDPTNQVIVHAGREEVRLCRLWAGQTPGNLFDLQIAAGLVGLAYPLGHATLVSQVVGVQLSKGETLTDGSDRPLTPAQVRYAFDDVRYLLPAWQRVAEQLEQLGRADWRREEFARLAMLATPEEMVEEKWRGLRGLGQLGRRQLAIVRALYVWREEMAARLNRPPRTIVRDDLLIEIARRNPHRDRDLHTIRGLARRDGAAIVEVVHRARELPQEQWPAVAEREIDPPQVAMVSNVLSAVLSDLCVRFQLASSLVATTSDVRGLVRSRLQGEPPPAESLLSQGWRGRHVLPELLAVLDGRRSLRIANLAAEAPFDFAEADKNE